MNVDALLLAAFAAREGRPARLAVDLGAGVGALGLALLYSGAARRVEFIERDVALAALCTRNLEENGWRARGGVHTADLAAPLDAVPSFLLHQADLVVTNPPYFSPRQGERSRTVSSANTRRDVEANPNDASRRGELMPFLSAAAAALGRRGRLCLVYPAAALLEQTAMARSLGLVPKRLRFVHGRPNRPARISLLECVFGKPGGLVVEPPLVEFAADHEPSAELSALLGAKPGSLASSPPTKPEQNR